MVARKQILWQLRLNVVIASSILALLLPYFAPTNTQAQTSEQMVFDPTRLVTTGGITKHFPHADALQALSGYSRVAYQKNQLLTEDRDGCIWISTQNGLNKFDKKSRRVTAYKSKFGDATTLFDNDVWSVLTAKDGSLWVGTVTGLQ